MAKANDVLKGLEAKAAAIEAKNAELAATVEKAKQPIYPAGVSPAKVFAAAATPADKPTGGGFKSFGHYLHDVRQAAFGQQSDVLKAWQTKANADGLNETVGSEGGFLVPPEFSNELLRRTYDNDLLSRTKTYTCTGNSLSIPAIDETSRVDGSRFGGVRAYWESEAATKTASQPAYDKVTLTLKKLIGLCYVTDELLDDSGIALEQHLMDLFAQELAFKLGDAIINGTGAGMPQGVLNAPALVSVSKETGQAAATILFENINKMWARMYAPSRKDAVWFINQDVEPQLHGLAVNVGTGGLPAYLPPGGLNDQPYGMLKGRPIVPVEFCQTVGTVGDIIFADLSQYLVLKKGEAQSESSIHFKFDTDQTAFRVVMRADGRVWWTSALVPKNGSNTLSCIVALATRA